MTENMVLQAFAEKLDTDPAFAKQAAACESEAALVALAKQKGFFLSEQVADLFFVKLQEQTSSRELSDELLDQVHGGCSIPLVTGFLDWISAMVENQGATQAPQTAVEQGASSARRLPFVPGAVTPTTPRFDGDAPTARNLAL